MTAFFCKAAIEKFLNKAAKLRAEKKIIQDNESSLRQQRWYEVNIGDVLGEESAMSFRVIYHGEICKLIEIQVPNPKIYQCFSYKGYNLDRESVPCG